MLTLVNDKHSSNNPKDSWRPYHELSDLSVSVSDILTAQYLHFLCNIVRLQIYWVKIQNGKLWIN